MITKQDIICIPLTDDEIKMVMEKAREQLFISKIDNLRRRHANIQYDCIVRGYIGEYAIAKWLLQHDIVFDETNYINEDENIDIDFLYKGKNIELKTSLIPDVDVTLEKSIACRDIKLIKRGNNIEELRGDIHLQIFFDQRRKAKDEWLASREINIEHIEINDLFNTLLAKCYRDTTFFIGWVDKPFITKKINAMAEHERTWTFKNAKRNFWNCKITESNKPTDLPAYLKSL
ncbi:MAG: hypothetical protein LH615_02380 [Ferruginibacter sp.]|nr:hypothetical protein [Ferruginibacter sp.]